MAFYIKTGDLAPAIQAALADALGNPINLQGATVNFLLREPGSATVLINRPAVVQDFLNGIVQYNWQAGDTATPGSYIAEWQVIFPVGAPMTVPNLGYIDVVVTKNVPYGP